MITWPHESSDWADNLPTVYPVFVEIGAAIAERELLLSVCCSHGHCEVVRSLLLQRGARAEQLRFCIAPSNDTWARDYGPLSTLVDTQPVLNDFLFNGWGGRFEAELDCALSRHLGEQGVFSGMPMQSHDLILEGGAVETDGCGSLLATRSSIVSETRNPRLSEPALEQRLQESLGLNRFLWLDRGGIGGDDTDGHIDTLARFANSATILYATAPRDDSDHSELAAMESLLRRFGSVHGAPYQLQPLPFPGVQRGNDGRRLPASYTNFLIVNQAVLLPKYGVPQDEQAKAVFQKVFPERRIVSIDCRPLIEQNGSLHCLTMQFPQQIRLQDGREISVQ